jgi:hypothetical protein
VYEIYQRVIAQKRAARLVVAMRRYKNRNGYWPESLDDIQSFVQAEDLIDSVNGGSFVYRLTDENFILYSKGKNGIDDGGRQDRYDEEETGADDIPIWPSRFNETSKEDPNDK